MSAQQWKWTKDFAKQRDAMDRKPKSAVDDTITKVLKNPQLPGLNREKLENCHKNIWTVRLSGGPRLVYWQEDEGLPIFLYAGEHNPAYAWAERNYPKRGRTSPILCISPTDAWDACVVDAPPCESENESVPVSSEIENTSALVLDAMPGCGSLETARLIVIGKAPTTASAETGREFSEKKTGAVLDKFLEHLGLSRQDIFLTNATFNVKSKGDKVSDEEIQECRPFILNAINAGNASCVLALGGDATKSILNLRGIVSMGRYRASSHGGLDIPGALNKKVYCTYHPTYIKDQYEKLSVDEYEKLTQGVKADLTELEKAIAQLGSE